MLLSQRYDDVLPQMRKAVHTPTRGAAGVALAVPVPARRCGLEVIVQIRIIEMCFSKRGPQS